MEVFYINSSLLFISQRPMNYSLGEKTEYESCKHMPALLLWYLILQVINMLLGIPANILVLWLIHKSKGESSTSVIFILHLAVLDIFFCLTIPLELANKVYPTPSSTWYVLRFIYGVKDSSPIFLCCVCLDRYMAVLHPITFSGLKDGPHRAVLVTVVWLVTLAYSTAKGADVIVHSYRVFTAMILGTFAFMVFCNIAILWALGQSGPGRDERHPVKKRAFKMVLTILAIIIFNYFPPVALFPFKHYFSPDVFRCYVHYIAFGLMDFSSTIQPLLYLSNLSKERLPSCCSTCGLCCQSNQGSRN